MISRIFLILSSEDIQNFKLFQECNQLNSLQNQVTSLRLLGSCSGFFFDWYQSINQSIYEQVSQLCL
ncbi:hypothetical protein pb186bvf_020239 [Paramecium bursaria]